MRGRQGGVWGVGGEGRRRLGTVVNPLFLTEVKTTRGAAPTARRATQTQPTGAWGGRGRREGAL